MSMAEQFFQLATGTSEAAMRSSISRLYYANFHIAAALTDGKSHGDIAGRLAKSYGDDLGTRFRRLHNLRSRMDYEPDFFRRERVTDAIIWFQQQIQDGINLYLQLRSSLESIAGGSQ
jgi:uncharacterized protein (UPF0332 family)